LDGLRSFAILPVIFTHCCPLNSGLLSTLGEAGWMGVDLFFVLSGFLITGILVDSVASKHYYRNFIARRTVRIFPLYYVFLAVITPAVALSSHWSLLQQWGGPAWFFVYLGNFRAAWMQVQPPTLTFTALWSLQVEEQFYVLYPAVVFFLSRNHLRRVLIVCIITAPILRLILRLYVPGSTEAQYVLMPCRMDALAMGGLVAVLLRSPDLRFQRKQLWAGLFLAVLILSAICLHQGANWNHGLMSTLGFSATAAAGAFLLTLVVLGPNERLTRMFRWRPLIYTGQIAYGLYLLHAPASWAARSLIARLSGIPIEEHSALSVPITFAAAFAAASLSWKYFESPILRLKDRFTH